MSYSGSSKVEFCNRLGDDWRKLADYLEILPADQACFAHGDEGRGIWAWLERRGRLSTLPAALQAIGRQELATTLVERQRASAKSYYASRIKQWSEERFALDQRFVQLTLLLDQGEAVAGPRWQAAERFQDLREILAKVHDPALVLLGPPGSGKSTLLRHYELDCAQAVLDGATGNDLSQAPLTFFIQLNSYKTPRTDAPLPLPGDWLAECWAKQYPDLPALESLLREGRLTLLLDALNEMPHAGDEHIRLWKDFLLELARNWPATRVIFSCRSLDYSAPLSSKELPVPQVRIEPLSNEQVQRFVELYCPDHAAVLWRNLAGSPQLELLRVPYYLKMLVEQTEAGEIPVGRAALFTGFVRQALKREVRGDNPLFRLTALLAPRDCQRLHQARQWKTPYELPTRGILFDKLSALAFQMQMRRSARESAQVRIDYDTALDILDHERCEDILKAGEALGVLEEDLGRDEVLYRHQLLQEYFAARRLAATPEPGLVQVVWQSERVSPSLQETLQVLADSNPLPPLPGTGWEVTTLLATAMTANPEALVVALMETNLPLAGRCAAQPDVRISEALKTRIRRALIDRTQDAGADLRARIDAGLALGELGDPRFERRQGPEGAYLLPPLIEIPGGRYTLGSNDGLYEDETPVHTVELQPFAIGRFPVTNAEWKCFMDAGGYEDERWWDTAAAQAWWQGESTAEGPKQEWRELRQYFQQHFDEIRGWQREGRITSKDAENFERYVRMTDTEFEALLNNWYLPGRQTQPATWNDTEFNSLAQPVVGISWYEARAYCAWLSAQTSQTFRLPTEAEWEAAARGKDGRRCAYGDDFDPACGNTFESHIRRSTPIGVFPGGETPGGLVDMTGNVWEWTSSLYKPYPYNPKDDREEANAEGRRVARGGSWLGNRGGARAAYRGRHHPDDRADDLGFRVGCAAPIF